MEQSAENFGKMVRRSFLWRCLTAPLAFILAACGLEQPQVTTPTTVTPTTASGNPGPQTTPEPQLAATPACSDADDVTAQQTEGPYFKPSSPERVSLREAGISGTSLTVSGLVLATNCQPIAKALVDFWHCDDQGVYDNEGFKLRGHQFTDSQGRFSLETILPGVYPGRTRHIHVKVQAPDQSVLTTQLYFPNEAGNANDGIFSPELVVNMQDSGSGKAATFNFVLKLA